MDYSEGTRDPVMPGEKEFLIQLSGINCLQREQPVLDGAALVFRIQHKEACAELIVEVRLPIHASDQGCSQDGKLLVFLKNLADEPLKISVPEFVLNGGLLLPWRVGITVVLNEYRGESGEALAWQVPLKGNEDMNMLAAEIAQIIDISLTIIKT